MANKKTSVFGIYSSVTQAEAAVDALVNDGFTNSDVSVLMADNQGSKDFAHEKNTKAPAGTTTGVADAASGALSPNRTPSMTVRSCSRTMLSSTARSEPNPLAVGTDPRSTPGRAGSSTLPCCRPACGPSRPTSPTS